MSMNHKAFAFDWTAFERHLATILYDALVSGSVAGLADFIEHQRSSLTDPCEGQPLPENWLALMQNRDVHEYGDFALTCYYSPEADFGIGSSWTALSDDPNIAGALLGEPFGPPEDHFDPGRLGSYFQTPDVVASSLRTLSADQDAELFDFIDLLERCGAESKGVYVTF